VLIGKKAKSNNAGGVDDVRMVDKSEAIRMLISLKVFFCFDALGILGEFLRAMNLMREFFLGFFLEFKC
jgi:hypothetical protein